MEHIPKLSACHLLSVFFKLTAIFNCAVKEGNLGKTSSMNPREVGQEKVNSSPGIKADVFQGMVFLSIAKQAISRTLLNTSATPWTTGYRSEQDVVVSPPPPHQVVVPTY
jgi:hypothetical protein